MGLGQCTDNRLPRDGPRLRCRRCLALYLAPVSNNRSLPPQGSNIQRCQYCGGDWRGWILRLHPRERPVSDWSLAILGTPGRSRAHDRPDRRRRRGRADESASTAHRPPPRSRCGGLLWGGAMMWFVERVRITPDFLGEWLPGMVLLGIGGGTLFPNLSGTAVGSAPGESFATATGMNSVARQIGAA